GSESDANAAGVVEVQWREMKRRKAILGVRGRGHVRAGLGVGSAGAVAAVAAAEATGFVPQRAAQLEVVSGGSRESVSASFSPRITAPARLTFYVPQGYGLSLSASLGTSVGDVFARAVTDSNPSFG